MHDNDSDEKKRGWYMNKYMQETTHDRRQCEYINYIHGIHSWL